MKIFWDAYGLDNAASGVFRHAQSLALELRALGKPPTLVGLPSHLRHFKEFSCAEIAIPRWLEPILSKKILWPQFAAGRFPSPSHGERAICHGLSNFNLPPVRQAEYRKILTVHDLIPLLAPHQVSKAQALQARFTIPRAIQLADQIVCVSEWTRQTLIDRYPSAQAKVKVIPNGVGKPMVKESPASHPSSAGKIRVLSIARNEPYKRLDTAIAILRKSAKLHLTMVTDSSGERFLQQLAGDLLERSRLRIIGGVAGERIWDLYLSADVYLHTSLYEGFCLPAVEALQSGVPVVYQGGSGIDEVVGKKVGIKMTGADSLDHWVQAIEQAAGWRGEAQFVEKIGQFLAQRMTWRHAAEELLSVYNG